MALPNGLPALPSSFGLGDLDGDGNSNYYLNALIRGGEGFGFEKLAIADNVTVYRLTIPAGATACLLTVEGNASQTNKERVIRFREDGIDPDDTTGVALSDNAAYEIKNLANMQKFRIIATENLPSVIQIQYYS